jgi:hypothetical protein
MSKRVGIISSLKPSSSYLLATLLYTSCISKREYTVCIGEGYKKYTRRPYKGYHLQRFVIHDHYGQIRPKQSKKDKTVKFGQNGHGIYSVIGIFHQPPFITNYSNEKRR